MLGGEGRWLWDGTYVVDRTGQCGASWLHVKDGMLSQGQVIVCWTSRWVATSAWRRGLALDERKGVLWRRRTRRGRRTGVAGAFMGSRVVLEEGVEIGLAGLGWGREGIVVGSIMVSVWERRWRDCNDPAAFFGRDVDEGVEAEEGWWLLAMVTGAVEDVLERRGEGRGRGLAEEGGYVHATGGHDGR